MGVDENIVIATGILYYGKDFPRPREELEQHELEQYFIADAYDEDAPTFFALNPEHLDILRRSSLTCSGTTWSITPFKGDIYDLPKIIDAFKEYIIDSVYKDAINRGNYRDIPREQIEKYLNEVGDFILRQATGGKVDYGKYLYRYFT